MASRACCSYRTWLFLSVLLLTLARLFGVWESLLQGLLLLIGVRLEEVPELPELPDLKSFASFHLGGGGGTSAQNGLAAFTFQFQTCGDWTAQRLQLVLGMTTAVVWGAQVIIPDSQPAQTANFLDFAPGDGWDRRNLFTSLYSFQDQEEHLRKVFKDYWCRPQQRSSPAADLWCSQDGLPSILNRSPAQKLLRETLTPQTVRQCEDTAPLGAASKAFGAQTWSYWTHSDGSNVMKPLNIEMVKCDCTFANVEALELSDQDLEIFWKDAVQQLKSGLQKYNVTARENAERLGYQRPHSLGSPRFHVLQLLRHDPCDEEEAMRRDNCMNNTMEVGNLMLAQGAGLKRLGVIDSCIIVYPKMESQAATRDIEAAPQDQEPEVLVPTETSQEREDSVVSRPDQVRRVTFQLPAESGSPAVVERHAHRGDTTRSGASPWRFPKASRTVPVYVERAFRVKTFALVSVQQGICFGIMLVMHVFILIEEAKGRNWLKKSTGLEVAYYSLSLIDMLCLMQLWIVRNSFPTNYCLMLAMTILSGLLWGFTETVLMTKMHLQLMASTTITFAVASLLSAVLTREKPWCKQERIVPIALSIGWTVGTVVVVTVSEMYHIGRSWEPMLACGFVFLLLTLLLFETRRTLLCSNPDDFMMCILILNASMLCLVSIPFFVILYGFLYVHRDEVEESEPVAAVTEPSPALPLDAL